MIAAHRTKSSITRDFWRFRGREAHPEQDLIIKVDFLTIASHYFLHLIYLCFAEFCYEI